MGDSGVNVLNGSIKELTFVQVSTIDGRTLQNTEIGSMLNTAAPTPEPFGSMADDGFYSKLVSCFFTFLILLNYHCLYIQQCIRLFEEFTF